MASEAFQLALLLTLKDAASGGLDRFSAKLRAAGKDGKIFADSFDKIRADLNRDLAIGGVGLAGLGLLKKGVDAAGDYEEKLFQLRKAYQELPAASSRSADQQAEDLKKITALATELGNQLQGSTGDYVSLFTSLNKAGIDATATLNGTGKAVAYLANVTGAIKQGTGDQLAEDFGSFAKMFAVTGEQDLMKMVNLFAAIDDRFNLQSSNLIESSKYFFSTAKDAMNLTGAEGAGETAKLMAFMKRFTAREGSIAGTSLDNLVGQYLSHKEKLEALKKETGINLEFFDSKGKFKGDTPADRVKTLFTELEKLQKLNPKERATWLKEIFGEVGFEAASAISNQGVKGWQEINSEIAKSVPVQTQIIQQMSTYNAKTEALSGSWQNFKATAFTPLMEDAKKFVDTGSSIVNSLQSFSAAHPGLMKSLGTLALYGTTALTVYGGIKTLTTGIRLLKLASAFSRGEGLLNYLNQTNTAANATTASLATTTAKARGLRGALQSQPVKIGVQIGAIIGIEYLLSWIKSEIEKAVNAGSSQGDAVKESQSSFTAMKQAQAQGVTFSPQEIEGKAGTAWFTAMSTGLNTALMSEFRKLPFASLSGNSIISQSAVDSWLYPISYASGATNPYKNGFWSNSPVDQHSVAAGFKMTTPQLEDPRIMTAFLKQMETRISDPGERDLLKKGLNEAFPESFAQAMREISGINFAPLTESMAKLSEQAGLQKQNLEIYQQQGLTMQTFGQNLSSLQQPLTNTQQGLTTLGTEANKVPSPLNNITISANNASNSLNLLSSKISNWTPPAPQSPTLVNPAGPQPLSPFGIPSRAIGGVVERDGIAMVHAGNVITPAKVTRGLSTKAATSGGFTLNYSPQVTIGSGGDREDFRSMLYDHTKDLERIFARQLGEGRVRS